MEGQESVSAHRKENQDCRISQAHNEENISKKEGIFICITYCRGAKREIVEA